jgi:hypothetical protein
MGSALSWRHRRRGAHRRRRPSAAKQPAVEQLRQLHGPFCISTSSGIMRAVSTGQNATWATPHRSQADRSARPLWSQLQLMNRRSR